ncbi:MAG: ABC transporter permease [Opitutae bacterium]|nr:ABC transporter permease [Opitutae bacterium]MBT6461957.1 ABC transporter permease [Opitutae bacterium]MBT6957521.1 ABC transporter permease [Opitutae bacterium]MBT7853466.1 ABC transporter permease [Opitutae bacterium]
MQAEQIKATIKVVSDKEAEQAMVNVSGDWLLKTHCPRCSDLWNLIPDGSSKCLKFNFSKLGKWDTGLMVFLIGCMEYAEKKNILLDESTFPDGVCKLLELSRAVPEKESTSKSEPDGFLNNIGRNTREILEGIRHFLSFTGEVALGIGRVLTGKKIFRGVDFLTILYQCSVSALPIVGLISLLSGLTMAFVGAVQLQKFGAEIFVADLVGLAMVREMGALMAAIVMTGRTGASFAAQLGNMRVSEEIDAYKTMGIRPVDFLVVPRLLALILVMPMLCMYANLIGIIGGYLVGVLMLDMSPHQYLTQTINAMSLKDLFSGEMKSFFFGMVVAVSGCFYGINCGQSSVAVGQSVTRSVVTGITFIIVVDAIFAVVFHILGI